MTNNSPTFRWPSPPPDDISVQQVLYQYQHDPELLKLVLSAKAEQDKRRAIRMTLQLERARILQRQQELERLRCFLEPSPPAKRRHEQVMEALRAKLHKKNNHPGLPSIDSMLSF